MDQREEHVRSMTSSAFVANEGPSCVFLNTYYGGFLKRFYESNPHAPSESYDIHKGLIQAQFFGDCDFYSEGLKRAGWKAEDLVVNCTPLQRAWGKESGFSGSDLEICIEQIRRLRPCVVYLQDMGLGTEDFLSAIGPYAQLIVGQIASPVPEKAYVSGFGIIFSSFPHFVERFREAGIASYYQPLAFDPRILEKIDGVKRRYPVTFIGGISPVHGKGKEMLETLAGMIDMDFWGYGAETLGNDSPIKEKHHGQAWGLEMFSLLAQSQITINRHIDVAEDYANNMRLFEATGCGALLITDYKDNLDELFEIGKEVVAYRSPEQCAHLVKYFLANPREAEKIAQAGQERTLRDHTYTKRMEKTSEILGRHLRYRRDGNRYPKPDMSKISYGYTAISPNGVSKALTEGWKHERIPRRQRALVQQELEGMYQGRVTAVYQVLAECLRSYISEGSSVLEIGSSSGYYYEVLEYLLNKRISYTGVDYSEPLISMAMDYYPKARFSVADGARLPFKNSAFFVAISSCILLHVPNWCDHIRETVRVADRLVVAHRTPVSRNRPTQYLKKLAYGVETLELVFNETEIVSEFISNGLKMLQSYEYHSDPGKDVFDVTFLFERIDTEESSNRGRKPGNAF